MKKDKMMWLKRLRRWGRVIFGSTTTITCTLTVNGEEVDPNSPRGKEALAMFEEMKSTFDRLKSDLKAK